MYTATITLITKNSSYKSESLFWNTLTIFVDETFNILFHFNYEIWVIFKISESYFSIRQNKHKFYF